MRILRHRPAATHTTVDCPICAEPISRAAKACKHCKADLTWRRHLSFSNTTLALLTALVAVLSSSIPAFRYLAAHGDSDVHLVLLAGATQKDSLQVLASNDGVRGGAVVGATLVVEFNKPDQPPALASVELPLLINDELRYLPEEHSALLVFSAVGQVVESPLLTALTRFREQFLTKSIRHLFGPDGGMGYWELDRARCKLQVRITNASGSEATSSLPIKCIEAGEMLAAHIPSSLDE